MNFIPSNESQQYWDQVYRILRKQYNMNEENALRYLCNYSDKFETDKVSPEEMAKQIVKSIYTVSENPVKYQWYDNLLAGILGVFFILIFYFFGKRIFQAICEIATVILVLMR